MSLSALAGDVFEVRQSVSRSLSFVTTAALFVVGEVIGFIGLRLHVSVTHWNLSTLRALNLDSVLFVAHAILNLVVLPAAVIVFGNRWLRAVFSHRE